jgi:sec-independent protein translocase protein TatA
MFDKIGPLEIGIILVIVVIIFGVGKLPQIGSDLGKSIRAFKQSQQDDDDEEELEAPKTRRKVSKRHTQAV